MFITSEVLLLYFPLSPQPAVCQRELCVFSHQTLGVMQGPSVNIATGAEVVDLLVAMVVAAVQSKRKNIIFDPYPMVVDPFNSKEFAFHHRVRTFSKLVFFFPFLCIYKLLLLFLSGYWKIF